MSDRKSRLPDPSSPAPNSPESERYSRQVLFPGIGAAGQAKLLAARVVIVGCGATGSAVASLLARAGVGTLCIIDRDYVEPSNLQRQSLFDEADAAQSLPKAIAAARKIALFNSHIVVEPVIADLVPANIAERLSGFDLILDGTDNFETRFLLNDYAVQQRIPWIYTAAVGAYGLTMNIIPGETACLRCIFPAAPAGAVETCETAGILNSAVNFFASIATTEALKFLVGADVGAGFEMNDGMNDGVNGQIRRTLLAYDLWSNQRSEMNVTHPRPDCEACQRREFTFLAGEGRPQITLCGRNSVQIHERHRPLVFDELSDKLKSHGKVMHNDFVLKFWRDPYELTLFPDGRAIIKGTTDTAIARSLYARYIGS